MHSARSILRWTKSSTPISGDDVAMFEKFLDMLNDLDDVQNVYHDAEY